MVTSGTIDAVHGLLLHKRGDGLSRIPPTGKVGDPLREWECLIPQATNGSNTSVEVILRKARLFNYLRAPLMWHGSWYRVPGRKERRAKAVGMSEEQRAESVF